MNIDETVPRSQYLSILDSYRKNEDIIKVITGIRRCGKSTLLKQFRLRLLSSGVPPENIIFVDLEENADIIDSERMLLETLSSHIVNPHSYVLMDEVQYVKGWEKAVNVMRLRMETNFYITGSNSKMASSELGTLLTGRCAEIHILPFSFKEFVVRYPTENVGYTGRMYEFLRWGGMPIVNMTDDDVKKKTILRGVYDTIINRDLQPNVSLNSLLLERVTDFMMSNIGNLTSSSSVKNAAHVRDPRTVENYLKELCKFFVFYKADRYDIVGKKHIHPTSKYYAADTGLRNSVLHRKEIDYSSLLENAVYLELIRRGYDVSVGSYNGNEIDFTAWKGDEPEFFQVSLTIAGTETLKREIRLVGKIGNLTVITMDTNLPSVNGAQIVNAVDWFLS